MRYAILSFIAWRLPPFVWRAMPYFVRTWWAFETMRRRYGVK